MSRLFIEREYIARSADLTSEHAFPPNRRSHHRGGMSPCM